MSHGELKDLDLYNTLYLKSYHAWAGHLEKQILHLDREDRLLPKLLQTEGFPKIILRRTTFGEFVLNRGRNLHVGRWDERIGSYLLALFSNLVLA